MSLRLETAFVLAAGLGTRMRHLTADRPKPLVEVGGRTLLDRVLDRIAAAGIGRAVVNLHYKADLIEAALAKRTSPRIVFSDERDALLDTGGGAARALRLIGDGPFLVHNSDSIWLETGPVPAITALADAWNDAKMDCLMLLAERATSLGFDGPGDFAMDDQGRLERRGTRPETPYVFTGVSIASPRLFDDAPAGPFSLNLVWDRAIARGRLFGTVLDGRWMHVGTPEAVAEAASRLSSAN
ncbi:MAG: nucleotidyltransferase family protein [Hyphomicrobiaceae bacterium]|nr:nucleotidyltransferase family protein [Hyphomicrobiaceae bacterium]